MDYLLAIDGGGSKTEFALADQEGNIVRSVTLDKGTNPWKYFDFSDIKAILEEGLEKLAIDGTILACVAGISGCHGGSLYEGQFKEALQPYFKEAPFYFTGDILTSFRAATDSASGVLAINGSGSAIAILYEDGSSYTFDAVGTGGRDIAVHLILSAQQNQYSSELSQWLESIIGESVTGMSLGSIYDNPHIYKVARALTDLPEDHIIRCELQPFLYNIGVRWAIKIWGAATKYRNLTDRTNDDKIEIVLNGGVWRLSVIRETTITLLKDANATIIYDEALSPVVGAIKIAKQLIA